MEIKSKNNKQWTGLPVSVGIAPSKTLAKIAPETAEFNPQCNGILNLVDNPQLDDLLKNTELTDIWEIGPDLSQRLYLRGNTECFSPKTIDQQKGMGAPQNKCHWTAHSYET